MIVESGVETIISSYLNTSIILKLSKAESSVKGWPFNNLTGSLKLKINKLKPHYKEVIELKCFNELSYKEISKKLNQPVNNIKVKVLRAKKILSQLIKEND